MKIRFRIDSFFDPDPPAQPGDTWRVNWAGPYDAAGNRTDGPIAGYAICCPKCGHIHHWTTSNNCKYNPVEHSYERRDGQTGFYTVCGHSGKASCWEWTGSAEDGTLTASPSLHASGDGACGWHGWLRNGVMSEI